MSVRTPELTVGATRFAAAARRLLRWEEREVPEAVLQTARFFAEHGVWYTLSRNPEARSCRDAAGKRVRADRVGIPLRDEMKSFLGRTASRSAGAPEHRSPGYVMAHCRGDCRLDLSRVAAALHASAAIERVGAEELTRFGFEYGLVNPFAAQVSPTVCDRAVPAVVRHVFDDDLLRPGATVMTNAGDLTWAVEFRAWELFSALRQPLHRDHPPFEALSAAVAIADPAVQRADHRPCAISGAARARSR